MGWVQSCADFPWRMCLESSAAKLFSALILPAPDKGELSGGVVTVKARAVVDRVAGVGLDSGRPTIREPFLSYTAVAVFSGSGSLIGSDARSNGFKRIADE